jgi:hypothetical protein
MIKCEMELSGLKLLLIIFSPLAFLVVILIFIVPYGMKVSGYYDKLGSIRRKQKDQIRLIIKKAKEMAEEKGRPITKEEFEGIRAELRLTAKVAMDAADVAKAAVHEDMGLNDIKNLFQSDIKDIFK